MTASSQLASAKPCEQPLVDMGRQEGRNPAVVAACLALAALSCHTGVSAANGAFTLRYFGVRGLGEPIRLMLAEMGKPFSEVRYRGAPFTDWSTAKEEGLASGRLPFGQVPSLTDNEAGVDLVQSRAIMKYLHATHNSKSAAPAPAPTPPAQQAGLDMLEGAFEDLRGKWTSRFRGTGKAQDVLRDDVLPLYVTEDLLPLLSQIERVQEKLVSLSYMKQHEEDGHKATPLMAGHGGDTPAVADFVAFDVLDINMRLDPSCMDRFPHLKAFLKYFVNRPGIAPYLAGHPNKAGLTRIARYGGVDTDDRPPLGDRWLDGYLTRTANWEL